MRTDFEHFLPFAFCGWLIFSKFGTILVRCCFRNPSKSLKSKLGPVAQLGARFHGMEEVVGSNPTRSTNPFNP
jgi:hypothetical protein